MNQRSILIGLIIVLVAGGAYSITYLQQLSNTADWLIQLSSLDAKQATDAMQRLATSGIQMHQRLVRMTNSLQPEERWRSAMLLGQLGRPEAAEALLPLLDDSHSAVRAAAAEALGRLCAQDAADKLARLLASDSQLTVRISAARALARLESGEVVPQLVEALQYRPAVAEEEEEDPSWQLRAEAARALGAIATPEAVAAVARQLEGEPNERVRTAIAYALGDALVKNRPSPQQSTPALDALIAAASDEEGDVRIAAVNSLLRVSWPGEASKRVEQVLQHAHQDSHYWVRRAVGAGS